MISRSIKGVCSELIAVKDFLRKGYYVARSIDPQCPFDIVVVNKKGKATLLDVKSVSRRKTQSYNCKPGDTINRSVSKRQKSMGIKIYYANGDQKFYYWNDYIILHCQNIYMKFNKHYEPIKDVTNYVCKHIKDGAKVLELGPGEHPFPKATHFCGWSDQEKEKLNNYKVVDFSKDKFPY